MAGGFVYNVIETPELSTSEIYGKTLADLAKEHKEIVAVTADLQPPQSFRTSQMRAPTEFSMSVSQSRI